LVPFFSGSKVGKRWLRSTAGISSFLSKGRIPRVSSLGICPWPRFQALASPSQALASGFFSGSAKRPTCSSRCPASAAHPPVSFGKEYRAFTVVLTGGRAALSGPGAFLLSDGGRSPVTARRFGHPALRHGLAATSWLLLLPMMTGAPMSPEGGVRGPQRMCVQFARPVPVLLPAQVVGPVLVA